MMCEGWDVYASKLQKKEPKSFSKNERIDVKIFMPTTFLRFFMLGIF